ncbi:MAG: M14 family zinc carboxypeptidase, partial [Bacteroidota bacterium]
MKHLLVSTIFLGFLFSSVISYSQTNDTSSANQLLKNRGEVYFRARLKNREELDTICTMVSVDDFRDGCIYAYANRQEWINFLKMNKDFELLTPPSMLLNINELNMGNVNKEDDPLTTWNFYPTYQQYLDFMTGFATAYPTICKVDTIGTTVQGRLILAVKISDSVQFELGKPRFLYTSSIHGDELTGYVLMLHLIDYLLSGYGSDQRITSMLNNTEIWINPLANPDGTYHGGNNTVFGATRFNANNIDLNRNFPDPAAGPHPDGNSWQQETVNFMSFADTNHFVQSMNFHGGSQVFNYPWDTWAKLHPDNSWFNYLGREWADTVHKYAPSGYMTDMDNGVTNGYAWYRITGGRQDYMTYFQYGREVTLEISTIKTPSASQLPNYWNYNYHSFLNYIEQAEYGINGQITDTITGEPLSAKVTITTHDFDNSQVYSYLPSGCYFRPVYTGNYKLNFTAAGYFPKIFTNVGSTNLSTTRLNVQM